MANCIVCDSRVKGRGNHCSRHNYHSTTRRQDYYNYNSDSTDPSSIRLPTNNRNRPRTLRFANTNNTYGQYPDTNALVRYDNGGGRNYTPHTAMAQPLINTFKALSPTHAISSLTYSFTPNGGQSLTAQANFDREKCMVCDTWFPDGQKLESHQWEFSVGCQEHGVCMREEDVQWHGTSERHERCFVRGCHSVYRKEGGWKGGVIKEHVVSWHC